MAELNGTDGDKTEETNKHLNRKIGQGSISGTSGKKYRRSMEVEVSK